MSNSVSDLVSARVQRLKPKPRPTLHDAIQGTAPGENPAPRITADAISTVQALGAASFQETRRHERIAAERQAAVADRVAREDVWWKDHQQKQSVSRRYAH
jgi:hypothetical protein